MILVSGSNEPTLIALSMSVHRHRQWQWETKNVTYFIKVLAQRLVIAYPKLHKKITFHFNKQTKQTVYPSVFHTTSFEDKDM